MFTYCVVALCPEQIVLLVLFRKSLDEDQHELRLLTRYQLSLPATDSLKENC